MENKTLDVAHKNKPKEKHEEHYNAQISDPQIILKEISCSLWLNTWFNYTRIYVALAPMTDRQV